MNPYLNKKAIVSKRGQWDYPGQDTIVPTPDGSITMQGVNYPVYGQDETGYGQMMYPNKEYQFPGKMVYETPIMESGGITKVNPYKIEPVDPVYPNDPYLQENIDYFNKAKTNAQTYMANRLNNPEYLKRLKNEVIESNKLNNVKYDAKTGANKLLEQRKLGYTSTQFAEPTTQIKYDRDIINKIIDKKLGGLHTVSVDYNLPEYQREGPFKGSVTSNVANVGASRIGINPILFDPIYKDAMESIIVHESEHSTQTPYNDYTNPYIYMGEAKIENGTLPYYQQDNNLTPYANELISKNIKTDDSYYSLPKEVMAGKRQVEHMLENVPEGTFKKPWKYGDIIEDEHIDYIFKDDFYRNLKTDNLRKPLIGNQKYEDMTPEEKADLKTRTSNIMLKLAENDMQNPFINTARNGTMIKRADGSYSQRGLWDNIRANKGSGNKPTKQMLEQEKKIKQKEMQSGGKINPYMQAQSGTQAPTYSWGTGYNEPQKSQVVETYGSGHSQTLPSTYTGDLTKITQKLPEGVGGSGNSLFMQGVGAVDKALGQYLVQPAIELFNTPFALTAEGVNAIQGKEYDFNKALPNPTRMALNAEGMSDLVPQQQFLSDYLGVDREKNPYLAMGLDILTPGPAMFTKPLSAVTGIGKTTTNAIKYAPKMNMLERAIDNPVSFFKNEVNPVVSGIDENLGFKFADQTIDAQKAMHQVDTKVRPISNKNIGLNNINDEYIDDFGNKINPKEVSKFIEEKGLKIIEEGINTPEGRRRLANQFKKENPKLTSSEIDDLIETRIAEAKASVVHNKPKYFVENIENNPLADVKNWFNDTFPLGNAHWAYHNPSYPTPTPTQTSFNLPNTINLKNRPPNPFTNPDFQPGSITLGRGYADDLFTLDHELGHATQRGGQMPIDRELVELIRPKNIYDKGWEWFTKKVLGPQVERDYKYFSQSGGRRWNNEAYPHLRETRRKMIEKGILKDTYDKVTPLKLFKHAFIEPGRLLSFTPPWKFSALSKIFNEAPAVIPGAIGTGAAAATIGGNILNQETPQQRYGGETNSYLQARSGIYIKPENRGKFTAWAQNHDMGVQEAASKVMANKEEYSPSVVKMANFAKNAAGWKKGQDGLEANLPKAPTNMFSDYNPVSDDYTAAMTGMMKARIATDAEFGNTAAKRMTSLYPKTYTFTGDEMFYDEKVDVPAGATGTHYTTSDGNVMFPIIQEGQDGNLFFNRYANPYNKEAMRFESPQDASYFGENYKSIAPMMYNQQMSKGGESDLVPVEVERSERIYDQNGNLLKEIPADAPTHEEGGVKLHLRPGTLVFPKKYYKALDAASGLPEFNKIKEKMLDNAEKAYLRGEPYSSGGRRN